MTIYPVNIENRQYLKFLSNLSPDSRFLLLIVTALSLWFSLACMMWNLYPDATLSIKGNMTTFLKFGSRNSIGFLMVFGSISFFLFLLKSKSEPLLSFAIRTISNNYKYIAKSGLHLCVGIITFCIFHMHSQAVCTQLCYRKQNNNRYQNQFEKCDFCNGGNHLHFFIFLCEKY